MSALTTKPFQIYLREGQLEALWVIARRQEQPIAELVRQGVDLLLATIPLEEDPLLNIVGMFDSGIDNIAAEHDHYLTTFELDDHHKWAEKSSLIPAPGLP